jgi:iron complex transport system substrate-binding protein
MKKKICLLIVFVLLVSLLPAFSFTANQGQASTIQIYFNDEKLNVNAFVENGRTMVPVRVLCEKLGATVEWDSVTKSVTIKGVGAEDKNLNLLTIKLTTGKNIAIANGKEKPLNVPPKIVSQKLFVPLRFIAETFGAKVEWDSVEYKALITFSLPKLYTIEDMAGRSVRLPVEIKHIVALHPIPTYMIGRLAPQKLVSVDRVFKSRPKDIPCYPQADLKLLDNLPVTGVFFDDLNLEQLLSLKPDVIITMTKDPHKDDLQKRLGIPVFAISKDTLDDYEESFRLMGKILGNEREAKILADYWHNTIEDVRKQTSSISESKRLKVCFFANNFLGVPGRATVMASVVELAGGINVAKDIQGQPTNEGIIISREDILKWNPDVIISGHKNITDTILNDPALQVVKAVKEGKVYTQLKFECIDGVQALMGLLWLKNKLYGGDEETFKSKVREFYNLYYHYQITDEQIKEVQE